ncbi:MAG: DUF362 domain-containing protein, partial [Proteobacteria bacterium]|nr:DUF362 domain-containing protein [Pseudomonadota bacterium]
RMCCDLNRCLYYSDREGLHLDAKQPVRTVLTLIDGIVAGEGEGPLTTHDVPLGVVVAGTDPVGVDLACVRLMGFDERRIEKLWGPIEDEGPRITAVRDPADVRVHQVDAGSFDVRELSLDQVESDRTFVAHPGWRGHIERAG